MKDKVTDAFKDLLLEITSLHLDFVEDLVHHFTLLQSFDSLSVNNFILQQSELLTSTQVVPLLLQKVYFLRVASYFLKNLQALGHQTVVF